MWRRPRSRRYARVTRVRRRARVALARACRFAPTWARSRPMRMTPAALMSNSADRRRTRDVAVGCDDPPPRTLQPSRVTFRAWRRLTQPPSTTPSRILHWEIFISLDPDPDQRTRSCVDSNAREHRRSDGEPAGTRVDSQARGTGQRRNASRISCSSGALACPAARASSTADAAIAGFQPSPTSASRACVRSAACSTRLGAPIVVAVVASTWARLRSPTRAGARSVVARGVAIGSPVRMTAS